MAKVTKRIWKTKDGRISSCWALDFKDEFGKRTKSGSFKTKVEAETALSKILANLNNGINTSKINNKMTFAEVAQLHIELHAGIHCKPNTITGYISYLKNHILPYFGKIKLVNLDKVTIERFIVLKRKEGYANQTIDHFVILIKSILSRAVDDGLIIKNPADKVKKLKLPRNEIQILELKEIHSLLDAAKKYYPDFYPFLFTAIFTGMRSGEQIALTWDKINWQTQKISVEASYSKGNLGTPKTENSYRKIDMCKELVKVLREWKIRCPHSDKNLVFPNQNGNYLDGRNLKKRKFIPILRKVGVNTIRWHDLRHTYCSMLISQNVNLKYIQKQMGHGSIQVTMDIYGHLMSESTQQGINALDALFTENISKKLSIINE